MPAGAAANGLNCNVDLLSHQGNSGGFKVLRYVDTSGHECAFYDTALLFPLNALKLSGDSLGVAVLDMANPAKPVQTATLTEAPMMSPHESLSLNTKRGLLAAVLGNPSTYPGLVSIYDVREDCRHPQLQSSALVARLGHESGFTPDGNTFYATSTATNGITAVDVRDPKNPKPVWQGDILSHGMSLSEDGNRAYLANATGGYMTILDTSEIQARKDNPQAREVSRLTWGSATIPQNAIPFERDGSPYILEFDEYAGNASAEATRTRSAPPASSTSRTSASRGWCRTCASRSTSRRSTQRRAAIPAPPARCRDTRRTTATSRRRVNPTVSPARSSPRACACSTSAT